MFVSKNGTTVSGDNTKQEDGTADDKIDGAGVDTNQDLKMDKQGSKSTNDVSSDMTSVNKSVDSTDDQVDLSCGIWKFRTNLFGPWFANLYMFSIATGMSSMFAYMAKRIVSVQLESLEKQFKINNTYAGLFETTSKIGLLATVLFSGHFTRRVNIPVIIGIAGIIQGLLLMAPAFLQLAHPYTLPLLSYQNETNSSHDSDKYKCGAMIVNQNNITEPKNATEEVSQLAFIVVLVAQTMKGITESFHTQFLPTVYMDDNMLDKTKMSLFLGIRFFIDGFSGPLGTEINGILTEVPIDLKKTDLSPKDGRFVAAWWLAFLMCGAGLVITSIPLMLFPRTLVSEKQRQEAHRKAKFFNGPDQGKSDIKMEDEINRKMSKVTKDTEEPPRYKVNGEDTSNIHVSDPTLHREIYERKGSISSVSAPLGRKFSMFPPLDGPTERKVSLTGSVVFEQPTKRKLETCDEVPSDSFKDLIKVRISTDAAGLTVKQFSRLLLFDFCSQFYSHFLYDVPRSLMRLLKNPIFILGIVDISVVSIPISGMYMFRNVYMTMEYNVPMAEVAMATSITSVVGTWSGIILSSWLTSKVKSKLHLQMIVMATYTFQVAFNPLFLIFGCDNQPVYGASGPMGLPLNLTSGCDCTYSHQLLSCGDDGNNYLSPCYAGCKNAEGKTFLDCNNLVNSSYGTTVTPGLCSTPCHDNFLLYAVLHGVQYAVESGVNIPRWLLLLRVVEPRDRGFSASFYIFFYNIMSIPSPNVFGKLIDNACFIWDGQYCNLYDRDVIRYLMSGLDVGVNVLSILAGLPTLIILWIEDRKIKREMKDQSKDGGTREQAEDKRDNSNKHTETYKF